MKKTLAAVAVLGAFAGTALLPTLPFTVRLTPV